MSYVAKSERQKRISLLFTNVRPFPKLDVAGSNPVSRSNSFIPDNVTPGMAIHAMAPDVQPCEICIQIQTVSEGRLQPHRRLVLAVLEGV